ncbi:MAG: methylated-DNA--[protein]-cysteine S-methyltransferase [Magnetococcales bacterium]|nr:methylated-DNA--[protein]-cysteine S-methyltransferase [Magnetococcales bacterium]MBF0115715.1 methylated-DNA--[protein]-cysteine S-methyltransferase [Magnetococcales bacterium]
MQHPVDGNNRLTERRVDWPNTCGEEIPAALQPLLSPHFQAIHCRQGSVTALFWQTPESPLPEVDHTLLQAVRSWLADYFTGHFRPVPVPLLWPGTPFQQRVGHLLAAIPPGQTVRYGQLAQQLGSAPRAVGQAVAANPLPLLLPCHRVVGASGLGGFSAPGGVASKQWLLQWEQQHTQP